MVALPKNWNDSLPLPDLGCTLSELRFIEELPTHERDQYLSTMGTNRERIQMYLKASHGERYRIIRRELGGV